MVPQPGQPSAVSSSTGCLLKAVAFTLVAINVTWHALAALFVAGPPGLGVYLLVVVGIWVWGWRTMRRVREAEAGEPASPAGEG